jgi:hypothetical protein
VQEVRSLLIGAVADDTAPATTERVLFSIHVQDLDLFQDILQVLSSSVDGEISVIETRNAGAYLFRMPLFAAFWTEKSSQDGRIIHAVVDRKLTNSVIRQVQGITGDLSRQRGVLLTVQDLTYVAGAIAF